MLPPLREHRLDADPLNNRSAYDDHCTVPRARPPEVRQEHPAPTDAGLVRVQVRTAVTQDPPTVDEIGVWYVEYG